MDSPNFQLCELSSPKNNFFSGQMRRASSVGDLQVKIILCDFKFLFRRMQHQQFRLKMCLI
jgi:hypothetical protein